MASIWKTLRAFAQGYLTLHYGSCGGDPIAWEKDLLRRRAEEAAREAAEGENRSEVQRTGEAGQLVALRRPSRSDELS